MTIDVLRANGTRETHHISEVDPWSEIDAIVGAPLRVGRITLRDGRVLLASGVGEPNAVATAWYWAACRPGATPTPTPIICGDAIVMRACDLESAQAVKAWEDVEREMDAFEVRGEKKR
jgi:hypothetical protein